METRDHLKNGAILKSQMSRGNLFTLLLVILFLASCSSKTLSEDGLIGVWKRAIETKSQLTAEYEDGRKVPSNVSTYTYEIFRFNANRTFSFGEYGSSLGAFYEYHGTWRLNNDKTKLELFFDDGVNNSIDIRDYDGRSFIITSEKGDDAKYTKE